MNENTFKDTFSSFHLVGIGGIGMSGLAQLLRHQGCNVSGSDRAVKNPENRRIFDALEKQGIKLFAQDGSYADSLKPDALIYSTAIEDDNPDFAKAPADIPRIHRADALAGAMRKLKGKKMTAVSGSCGKTTVTAWLAETLHLSGADPSFYAGGLLNHFRTGNYAGNFYPGKGEHFIFEADESDKSLLSYEPEYAIILNIGTDHYPKDELVELFSEFLKRVRRGAVIEEGTAALLDGKATEHLEIKTFSAGSAGTQADYKVMGTSAVNGIISAKINEYDIALPMPGLHNAANAAAVLAAAELLGEDPAGAADKIPEFKGVWRRFDFAGKTAGGALVYDDYAHNVEKIVSCISAAREIARGNITAVFQPHGYGPLGFMKDELFHALEEKLTPRERFFLLPVYYAGGTSSFRPEAKEVYLEFSGKGKASYGYFESREEAEKLLREEHKNGDIILIMGARDNSLSDWAANIAR